jgi:hypothetical protein
MATPVYWLTCCCWASRIDPGPRARPKARTPHQHHPLAPSSAHDTLARSPLISKEDPPQPSAAPACQGAAPRDATASARLLRHCRFTRSIRPPVPRSGVAPHRSPQSLPWLPPPCQGSRARSLRPAVPSKAMRQVSDPSFPGRCSVPHPATLGTPSVYYDTTAMSSAMPSVTTSTWLAGGDGSVSQGTQQGYYARNTMSSGSHRIRGDAALVTGFFAEVTRHQ